MVICKNKLILSSAFSPLVSGVTRNQGLRRGTKLKYNKINEIKELQDFFNKNKVNFHPVALFAE